MIINFFNKYPILVLLGSPILAVLLFFYLLPYVIDFSFIAASMLLTVIVLLFIVEIIQAFVIIMRLFHLPVRKVRVHHSS